MLKTSALKTVGFRSRRNKSMSDQFEKTCKLSNKFDSFLILIESRVELPNDDSIRR